MRAGIAATRLANTIVAGSRSRANTTGDTGSGTTPTCSEKTFHPHRPRAMPIGMPMATAMIPMVVACHATAAETCRRTNPSVFSTAKSRLRFRTDVTSVWASVASAASPRRPARRNGRFWTLRRLVRLVPSSGACAFPPVGASCLFSFAISVLTS
jgi:hypothetical protein